MFWPDEMLSSLNLDVFISAWFAEADWWFGRVLRKT